MKLIKWLLVLLLLTSGCRATKNVTETDSTTDKVETVKSNTETISNKITEIKIPAHLFKQLAIDYTPIKDSSAKSTEPVITEDTTSSNEVTITTTENTVTKKAEDKVTETEKKVKEKETTEKKAVINWNYIWIPMGVVIVILGLGLAYKLFQ